MFIERFLYVQSSCCVRSTRHQLLPRENIISIIVYPVYLNSQIRGMISVADLHQFLASDHKARADIVEALLFPQR